MSLETGFYCSECGFDSAGAGYPYSYQTNNV